MIKISKREKIGLFCAALLLIAAAIAESAVPSLIGNLVDSINQQHDYAVIGGILLLLLVFSLLVNRFGKIIVNNILADLIQRTRNILLDVWNHTSWQKLKSKKSGEFATLVNDDLDNIQTFAADEIPLLIAQIIGFLVAITQFFMISKILTFLLISIYLIYFLPFRQLIKKQYQAQKDLRDSKISLRVVAADIVNRQEELNYINAGQFILQKFVSVYQGLNDRTLRAELSKNASKLLPRTIDSLGPAIVILYGGFLQLNGSITIGNFVTIFTYLGMFSAPFKNAMNMITSIQEVLVSIDKIKEYLIFNTKAIPDQLNSQLPDIRQSEYLILKGPSGIGKSTMLKQIFFDNPHNYKIMYIPQNVIIFPGTIRENLLRSDLDSGRFDDLLRFLPNLEADSQKLSTGQKMVLNVIRQTLWDADLILLDEIGANIDDNLKAVFNLYFMNQFRYQTIIEITHLSQPIISERTITRVVEVNNAKI